MNKRSGWAAIIVGTLLATLPTFVLFQMVTLLFVVPLVLGLLCVLLGVTALRKEGKFVRHVGWIAVTLMLVAVILPFGMIAYHNRLGYPIVLVVPEGYRGPVRLIIDRQQGVDVRLIDEKYTYHIPETGMLLIKDDSPFRQWHSMTAMYTDGKLIPIDHPGNLPSDAVSLHSLGSGARIQGGKREEYIEDFVGTKAELRKYVDR
jgi:hypothetical protein